MMVNSQWIPVENRFERAVADALVGAERSFIKLLRYGAGDKHAYANFVLRDTGERQVPMDIVVEGKDGGAVAAKEALIAQREDSSWVWRISQTLHMPPLPTAARQPRPPSPKPETAVKEPTL